MASAVRKNLVGDFSTRAFDLLRKRGWKEEFASWRPLSCVSKRSFSEFCSKEEAMNPPSVGMAAGSSEFEKWHKGGGLFHKSACVDPTAVIETGAVVHEKSVLGANVHLGSGAVIGPSVNIGQSTKIGYNAVLSNCLVGDSCVIHNGVCIGQDGKSTFQLGYCLPIFAVLSNCLVGDSCVIHNGVCIGQDGFGFFVDEHGNLIKKPQMLYTKIGNLVEVGANTCIDRGSWRDTVIGDHTKIDNLVQIGHNVVIGRGCMICGQVGIAGSVTMGDYITLGGKVAVRDHVSIASNVRLAASSCVTKDITKSGDYGGFPAVPINEWRRQVAALRRISKKMVSGS